MIKRKVIDFCVNVLISSRVIDSEDMETYRYAVEVLWMLLVPYIMMMPICILLGVSFEGYLLLIPFTILRRICGGFHFKEERTCYVVSFFFLFGVVFFSKHFINRSIVICLFTIMGSLSLSGLSILLKKDKLLYQDKKEIILINVFCALFTFLLLIGGYLYIAKWISTGIVMSAVLQYPLIISKYVKNQ